MVVFDLGIVWLVVRDWVVLGFVFYCCFDFEV